MFIYTSVSVEKTYKLCNVNEEEECSEYLCSFRAHDVIQFLQKKKKFFLPFEALSIPKLRKSLKRLIQKQYSIL